MQRTITSHVSQLKNNGKDKIVAFASREITKNDHFAIKISKFTLLGVLGMDVSIPSEVIDTLQNIKQMGVKVLNSLILKILVVLLFLKSTSLKYYNFLLK